MSTNELDHIVDRIYEAAVIPEHWPHAFDAVAQRIEAALGSLFIWRAGKVDRWIGTPAAQQLIADYVALARPEFNSRAARCSNSGLGDFGFVTDHDLFQRDEIERDAFYREFLHPRGYGWVAVTVIVPPNGDQYFCSWERSHSRGPFERRFVEGLDRLRPHLARSALIASGLDLQRAQTMTMALSAVGLPAAVLRRGGRLYAANSQFEKLIPDLARDRRDRLALADARADGVLGSALAQFAARGSTTVSVQSIPIPASDLHVAMILHVVPVRGSAHDVFSEMESLVVVTPVDRRAVPTAEVLRGLFDLTPAEARVAQGIGGGQGVDEIAARLGISRETVRVQLKAVLSKTGLNRQAQLSALLAGATIAN